MKEVNKAKIISLSRTCVAVASIWLALEQMICLLTTCIAVIHTNTVFVATWTTQEFYWHFPPGTTCYTLSIVNVHGHQIAAVLTYLFHFEFSFESRRWKYWPQLCGLQNLLFWFPLCYYFLYDYRL